MKNMAETKWKRMINLIKLENSVKLKLHTMLKTSY